MKQGTKVYFDLGGGITGEGEIEGIASIPVPLLGATYIVKIGFSEALLGYQYSHITVFESQITVLDEVSTEKDPLFELKC